MKVLIKAYTNKYFVMKKKKTINSFLFKLTNDNFLS